MKRAQTPVPPRSARVLTRAESKRCRTREPVSMSTAPDDWKTAFLKKMRAYDRLRMRLVSKEWALTVIQHVRFHSFLHTADKYNMDGAYMTMRLMRRLGRSADYAKIAEVVKTFSSKAVSVWQNKADRDIVHLAPVFMHAVFLDPDPSLHKTMIVNLHNFVCGCGRHFNTLALPQTLELYNPCINIHTGKCSMTDSDVNFARIGAHVWPRRGANVTRHETIEMFIHALRHGSIELAEYMLKNRAVVLSREFYYGPEWIQSAMGLGPMWNELEALRPLKLHVEWQVRMEGMILARLHSTVEMLLVRQYPYNHARLVEVAIGSGCPKMTGIVLQRFPPRLFHAQIEEAVANICMRMHDIHNDFYRIAVNRQSACAVLSVLMDLAEFKKPIVVRVPTIGPRARFLYDVYMALSRMRLETLEEYLDVHDMQWSDAVVCQ